MKEKFSKILLEAHLAAPICATPEVVSDWFKGLIGVMFPGFCQVKYESEEQIEASIEKLKVGLTSILKCDKNEEGVGSDELVKVFFNQLEGIYGLLKKDIKALFDGDPAAKSHAEIIRSYPGFYAIAAHRVAHLLYNMGVQLIPRIISENAHSKTGVDIHPGAKIGEYFCIDHGTGVVVGETTVVGNHVKIYQGVTLGALSVDKKNVEEQRHPTIQDGVVIYAGATILGGKTVVGKNSVVGGGVWLTRSVGENSKVYYRAKMTNEEGEIDTITFK